jgi:hypothetical protein
MLPTIILVHGAFAESASWDRVIDTLQNVGRHHRVIAAANPLEYADHRQPSLLDGGRFEPRSSRDPPFDNLGGVEPWPPKAARHGTRLGRSTDATGPARRDGKSEHQTKESTAMTTDRSRAYARVTKTVTDLGPAKLHHLEQRRIRDAADALVFAGAHDVEALAAL